MKPQVSSDWNGLRALCRILRGPDGCSWDRAQTIDSMTPYLLEETHEVLEAVATGDNQRLREELGDLLFLITFLIAVAEEESRFSSDAVIAGTIAKMVRRHPHVFGDAQGEDERQAGMQWERIKQEEKRARGDRAGRLASGAQRLPALIEAFRVQQKAAGHGFDWPDLAGVVRKLDEERAELNDALLPLVDAPSPAEETALQRVQDEIGDMIFTLVNLARHLQIDPEQALKATTVRFRTRFAAMEAILARGDRPLGEADLETMERAWQAGKRALRATSAPEAAAGEDPEPPRTPPA